MILGMEWQGQAWRGMARHGLARRGWARQGKVYSVLNKKTELNKKWSVKNNMEYKITEKISEGVIREILKVKEKEGLTAEAVVNQARKKSSPLHNLFEWNNEKASEMWRFQQARVLINEVKVIVEDKEYFAFENISMHVEEEEPRREYFERDEILSNRDLRKQIIAKALEQLIYWKEKYRQYNEFTSIIKEIDSFTEKQKVKEVA